MYGTAWFISLTPHAGSAGSRYAVLPIFNDITSEPRNGPGGSPPPPPAAYRTRMMCRAQQALRHVLPGAQLLRLAHLLVFSFDYNYFAVL